MNIKSIRYDLYKEAEEEGQMARLRNQPIYWNPYKSCTEFAEFWEKGYFDMDQTLRTEQ